MLKEARQDVKLVEVVPEQPKPEERAKPSEEETSNEKEEQKDDAFYQKNEDKVLKEIREVEAYTDFMKQSVRIPELIEALERPNRRDPLKALASLRAPEGEESFLEESSSHLGHFIIPLETFIDFERLWQARHKDADQAVDHRPVFDAFNEALDNERPYKSKGMPMPWSKSKRATRQKITEKQAKAILERAAKQVRDLNKMRAGCLYAPAPPPPPPADAMDQPAN